MFAIASMPEKTVDRLLVGCSGNILEYSAITGSLTAQEKNDVGSR
jgi:hypothetical protein